MDTNETSLIVSLTFPSAVLSQTHVIKRVNIYVIDETGKNESHEFDIRQSSMLITGLNQFTSYKLFAASGNGETFGKISTAYEFKTKGTYSTGIPFFDVSMVFSFI